VADLKALADWVEPLLAALSQPEQRKLARTIATELRKSQSQRIGRQQNPDGSAYAPRKPQNRRGYIKAKLRMFEKLRTARNLKAQVEPGAAVVGFMGRVARIAYVHQYGEFDRVEPTGPSVLYAQRQLLGYSAEDLDMIERLLIQHLGGGFGGG
jgi:phage virion morphogenesis protein